MKKNKPLVFMMGRSPAFLPTDRCYARNHMWVSETDNGAESEYRLGLTAYAVKLLGDMRSLEWSVAAGARVKLGQSLGTIEASKATSDLFAPVAGTIVEINAAVVADPTLLNSNLYDSGWLLLMKTSAVSGQWLSPEEYLAHVEAAWPLAQRILKGQAGR
ncbi:MAG: glycine cleavage system protein H [Planctomycetota bacterium]|nr:glycine cleavage system protein H [Planctomycetota bacterium]